MHQRGSMFLNLASFMIGWQQTSAFYITVAIAPLFFSCSYFDDKIKEIG